MLDDLLELALAMQRVTGELPLIIGPELYEYFDETVKIVEAYDKRLNIVVENRWATRRRADVEELMLRRQNGS